MKNSTLLLIANLFVLFTLNVSGQVSESQNSISSEDSYLGTKNDFDVLFKRNEINAGAISLHSSFFGVNSFALKKSISFGVNAGKNSVGEGLNTYLGHYSGLGKESQYKNYGSKNTFVGSYSGEVNFTGNENTFIGAFSAQSNVTGTQNTFLGTYSGFSNIKGNSNTYIGYAAGISNPHKSTVICVI